MWHKPVLLQRGLWGKGGAAPRTLTLVARAVCLTMKPVGEPYAGNPHVRFDERGWETERCRMAQATAPILDSTMASNVLNFWRSAIWSARRDDTPRCNDKKVTSIVLGQQERGTDAL